MSGNENPETPEQFAERIRLAERTHDRMWGHMDTHSKEIEAFAVLTLRSLVVVALGGIAATLGFYSANYLRLSVASANLHTVNWILVCLFLSLLMALLSSAAAYFSQIAFAATIDALDFTYRHPYALETPKSKRYRMVGHGIRWSSIVFAVTSLCFLVWAATSFTFLVT